MRARPRALIARLVAIASVSAACAAHRPAAPELEGFVPSSAAFHERARVVVLDSGVTATIVAPERLDRGKPVDLVLYALPNGNTTAQTMGKRLRPGDDWHFDIQHIAAQTRALRERGMPQAIVVYLEADTKSWPEWRRVRGYDRANARIVAMVDRIRTDIGNPPYLSVTLAGHSGGGSFMFGFIEGQAAIPDWIRRIAFLDAVYNFDGAVHGTKFAEWLRRDPAHVLVSIAYDDREIMLDGRKVVADDGGTWRATQRMIANLSPSFPLARDTLGEFIRYHASQVELLLHPNPANRILHTELIGEMNGYMHALLTHRPDYDRGASVLATRRAYLLWVDDGR